MLDLARLRLATAAAHRFPLTSMTLVPVDGPSVVVSRLPEHQPDMSPCTLRALVLAVMAGDPVPVALRWMFDVSDVRFGGSGVLHVGDGVVRVDGDANEVSGRWWPTLMDVDLIPVVLAECAADALEDGIVGHEVISDADVNAHVDSALGVAVIHLRTGSGSDQHERRCDTLARSMARSCVIAELLHSAGSGSAMGGR